MKKFFKPLIPVIALSLALASCNNDDNSSPEPPPSEVTLDRASATMAVGDTLFLSASVENVTWATSTNAVTVTNGMIIAESAGIARITATAVGGSATASASISIVPTQRGCNNQTPNWGESLGTVSWGTVANTNIESGITVIRGAHGGPSQVWSGAVFASACAKGNATDNNEFNGGSAGNFNADCRQSLHTFNAGRADAVTGDLFSWCAVVRFADQLCPYPWRVPSREDFANLHQNLGSPDYPAGYYMPTSGTATEALVGGVWGGARFTGAPSSLANDGSDYWSLTESSEYGAHYLRFLHNRVWPETSFIKHSGFALRCIRDYNAGVDPNIPVAGILLEPTAVSFHVGETQQLAITFQPVNATNRNVTWTSNNNAIATVVNGLVTAVAVGTTTITVTTQDGNHMATAEVTVNADVSATGVTLQPSTVALYVGQTQQLTANVQPANATNQTVTWETNNNVVATVSNSGLVTALGVGTATITVTTQDGNFTAVSEITVAPWETLPMTGCNSNIPGWGDIALGASFATSETWIVGTGENEQEWSDAVIATACADRTAFVGGSSGNFNADCRNSALNDNFSGHYFSWCAVMRFADQLCPPAQGWRVPTAEDFTQLHLNLGYGAVPGINTPVALIAESYMGLGPSTNGGAWGGAWFTGHAGNLGNEASSYWSSTDHTANVAISLHMTWQGVFNRATGNQKQHGIGLRCVR